MSEQNDKVSHHTEDENFAQNEAFLNELRHNQTTLHSGGIFYFFFFFNK